jgi:hypothetical protein
VRAAPWPGEGAKMSSFFPWFSIGSTPAVRIALTAFLGLDKSTQSKIADAVKSLSFPFRRTAVRGVARQLHEDLKILDQETIFSIIDVITDLVNVPSEALSDLLAQVFRDTGANYLDLVSIVDGISRDKTLNEQRSIEAFKRSVLPYLDDLQYFCAVRARFDKKFDYWDDKIEGYAPQIVDDHPVVVVKAELRNSARSIVFQLDEERLDRLISELIAAQKQLRVLAQQGPDSRKQKRHAK